jgi:hypothetical protein
MKAIRVNFYLENIFKIQSQAKGEVSEAFPFQGKFKGRGKKFSIQHKYYVYVVFLKSESKNPL